MNEIICTIGPSCADENTILKLSKAGVTIFRINLSHAPITDIAHYVKICNRHGLRLALDTEGAQLRTKLSKEYVTIKLGETGEIPLLNERREAFTNLGLYPLSALKSISKGTSIRLDFNGAVIEIIETTENYLRYKAISPGVVGHNKGVDLISGNIDLPDFTDKDILALNHALELGVNTVFLSFCKNQGSIAYIKNLVPDCRVIAKIESKKSIHELPSICSIADGILIDRGDLSREISILDIPFAQKGIVEFATKYSTPCYVATNVLESLIQGNIPTRAELNDIVYSLDMGMSGIVLAAETAIGKFPVLSVEIVKEMMHRFRLHSNGLLFADIDRNEITDPMMKVWLNRKH